MKIDSILTNIKQADRLKESDEKLTVRRGRIVTTKKNVVERAIDKLKEVFNGR